MKKKSSKHSEGEMLDEYDFRGAVRGKYYRRYLEGSNVVVLAPDVAKDFPDTESVNTALRAIAEIIHHRPKKASA